MLTEPKNMLIRQALFHGELFSWFIFITKCAILNFVDVGRWRRTLTVSLCGLPLARYQSNGLILLLMSFFYLKVLCHQHLIVCPLSRNILHKFVPP